MLPHIQLNVLNVVSRGAVHVGAGKSRHELKLGDSITFDAGYVAGNGESEGNSEGEHQLPADG